jgi:hypothetical protein
MSNERPSTWGGWWLMAAGTVGAVVCGFYFSGSVRNAIGFTNSPRLDCPANVTIDEAENLSIVPARFTVRNSGRAPLTFDNFVTTCGCAGFERTVEGLPRAVTPFTLAPGESDTLTVRWSVRGVPGQPHSVNASFRTNDPAAPVWTIALGVRKVLGGLSANPSRVFVAEHVRGTPFSQSVAISDAREARTPVTEIKRFSIPDWLKVEHAASTGGGIDVRLSGTPPADAESVNGYLHLFVAGLVEPALDVPVDIQIVAPYSVAPVTLSLPRSVGGADVYTGRVIFRSLVGPKFRVEAAEVAGIRTRRVDGRPDSPVQVVEVEVAQDRRSAGGEIDIPIRIFPETGGHVDLSVKVRLNPSSKAS